MTDAAASASASHRSPMEGNPTVTAKLTPSLAMHMSRLGHQWIVPMTLRAVIELKVADIIAQAGAGAFLTPREIAAHIPNSTDFTVRTVSRFLRLLTAHGVFTEKVTTLEALSGDSETVDRKFGLNELSRSLVEDGFCRANIIVHTQDHVQKAAYFLSETAMDGQDPFVKAHGMDMWKYHATRPELGIIFDKAMAAKSNNLFDDVVRDFAGLRDLKGNPGGRGWGARHGRCQNRQGAPAHQGDQFRPAPCHRCRSHLSRSGARSRRYVRKNPQGRCGHPQVDSARLGRPLLPETVTEHSQGLTF